MYLAKIAKISEEFSAAKHAEKEKKNRIPSKCDEGTETGDRSLERGEWAASLDKQQFTPQITIYR